ncbi:MAG: hypothetical protein P4L56_23250 [Candidatus Sulfopaludibacter sp.]|nr:hypothetical protein [Candidatus Sulfopaludibacter sp.]
MSVWPNAVPASLSLSESEGALVSVSIQVAPRHLESLLEALASIEFPINPQIYHELGVSAVVEFPAYENHLGEVRQALRTSGFDPDCLRVTGMLDAIRGRAAGQNP